MDDKSSWDTLIRNWHFAYRDNSLIPPVYVPCGRYDLRSIRGRKINIVWKEGVKKYRIKKFNNEMTQHFCHLSLSLK